MSKQRDDRGRYTSTVTDEELLHFFDAAQRDFYSAREIASEFDLDRTQAHRRLSRLDEEGELERVKVGNRNVVWWRPRDIVALIEEDEGYSIVDPATGVASQGKTRPEALRMLAEAIEVHAGKSEMTPDEIYDELNVDSAEIEEGGTPPW
jgi:predicted RNase H-like HicB family nuclease